MPYVRYAQNGYLAQWILDHFEPGYIGHALDIGASDGVSVNTTWALEKCHGWTVLCVEPNPFFTPMLRGERIFVVAVACDDHDGEEILHINSENPEAFTALRPSRGPESNGPWKEVVVPVTTVDALLAKWDFPKLDALCIDTEGTEDAVLRGCDISRWQPKVIVVEAWDVGTHDGYLTPFGYRRAARSVDNDLYVRTE